MTDLDKTIAGAAAINGALADEIMRLKARIAELEEKLNKLALMAETSNHWTDEHRLMPAAGVADIIYEAIEALKGEQT